jgi:hypothetical protein
MKTQLDKTLLEEYRKLKNAIELISAKQYLIQDIELMNEKISMRNLIAYQIGWGTLLVGWYETGVRGEIPIMPGEGFDTWDYHAIAHHFYKKYHLKSIHAQLEVFDALIHRIVSIIEKELELDRLDKLGVWKWCTLKSGKKWPLSKWIQVNTIAPYKRARILLTRKIKKS